MMFYDSTHVKCLVYFFLGNQIFACHSVLSADAVNNAAGYGFEGLDESGRPSWDLVSNLNIVGIEVAGFSLSGH